MTTAVVYRRLVCVGLATAGAIVAAAQQPVGTAFTYQGRLSASGAPVSGQADFQFSLWDNETGGSQIGTTLTFTGATVVDGRFRVELDFGTGAFGNEARWLASAVRYPGGSGSYTALQPRQELTPTPFSIATRGMVVGAGGDANFSGDVQTVGRVQAAAFASNSPWVAEAPAGIARAFISDTSGNFGINESAPLSFLHVTGSIDHGSGFNGSQLQHENVVIEGRDAWLGIYGTGIGSVVSGLTLGAFDQQTGTQKWSLLQDTDANGGGFRVTFGTAVDPLDNAEQLRITTEGLFGINEVNPAGKLHISAEGSQPGEAPLALRLESNFIDNGNPQVETIDVRGTEIQGGDGNGNPHALSLNPDGGSVHIGPVRGDATLNVTRSLVSGLTSSDETLLDVLIEDSANAWLGLWSDGSGNVGSGILLGEREPGSRASWAIYARTQQSAGDLNITYGSDSDPTSNTKLLQISPSGTTKVKVLEVTGADLAEKFPVRGSVAPGMVVEIDPEHPGELRLSSGPYSRRVAGIISGAGNLPAGAILGNVPGSEGMPPVALSGRVWVRCDTKEPIRPGDLLTSSETPGCAMKASDFDRARGATIGKAMTALEPGNGMVLVLVSLQ